MKPEEGLEFQVFVDGNEVTTQGYYSHLNRYRFASRFVKDKVCLDVGCGTGYGSAYLVKKGAKRVVGGDKSEEAIAYANIARTVPREGLEFSLLEATSLPFGSNSFDVVVCFEVIEHVKDCAGLLSETQRTLRRGGKLILSTPNGQAGCIMFKLPYHVHEFSKSELLNLADRYFNDPVMYGQCFLNKTSLTLRRPRWTTGRLLDLVGLGHLRIWLGKLLFRYNQVVVYKTKDFDNLADNEWEVMPLSGDLTPSTFVVVATKS